MEVYNVIVGFFKNGGVFMIPIVVILALGAAIAIERWVFLTITTAKNKALWNAVTPHLKAGNFAGAMQVTQKSGAVIGQIMTYGLNRVRSARRREDIEQAMEESDAFTAVSNANPAEKAELLTRSISIGMNCTAFGLMVAIPLVLIHSMLQTKTTAIVDSLEMASVKFLNAITERAQDGKSAEAVAATPAPAPRRG